MGDLKMKSENIYQQNGYKDRMEYLVCLAEDYSAPLEHVIALADVLGPEEDFDGLVSNIEDFYSF